MNIVTIAEPKDLVEFIRRLPAPWVTTTGRDPDSGIKQVRMQLEDIDILTAGDTYIYLHIGSWIFQWSDEDGYYIRNERVADERPMKQFAWEKAGPSGRPRVTVVISLQAKNEIEKRSARRRSADPPIEWTGTTPGGVDWRVMSESEWDRGQKGSVMSALIPPGLIWMLTVGQTWLVKAFPILSQVTAWLHNPVVYIPLIVTAVVAILFPEIKRSISRRAPGWRAAPRSA